MRTTTTAARNEPIDAEMKDCCHVYAMSGLLIDIRLLTVTYKANCYQRSASVPANQRELIREPIQW